MPEPAPKPAATSKNELRSLARAALRSADKCIRINQDAEALRLLDLARNNLARVEAAPR
jgi:hypothetical protein